MRTAPITAATLTLLAAPALAQDAGDSAPVSVPFPHPVLSEVLFAVPTGNDIDPSRDNSRDPVGDEFIEIYNPHDRAIDLQGYTIMDALAAGKPDDERGFRFVFPAFRLGPGEVAVVFNGYNSAVLGPHGTAHAAPAETNRHFRDAWLFSANNNTRFRALNNSDEFVALAAPDERVIDAVIWGNPDHKTPESALRVMSAPRTTQGSVARVGPDGAWQKHSDIDGSVCTPGVVAAATASPSRSLSEGDQQ